MTDTRRDWPPTTCEMPDLEPGAMAPYLGQILRGRGFFGDGAAGLSSVFCRLVSQAVDEYRLARECLVDYVREEAPEEPHDEPTTEGDITTIRVRPATWRVGPLLRAGGKLENCIQVLHRCLRCLESLRRRQDRGLAIDKNLAVLRAADRIRGFRDDIEHLYEDIAGGKIAPGQPHTLQVAAAEIRLREHRIPYEELARWLRQLRDVAAKAQES